MQLVNWFTGMIVGVVIGLLLAPPGPGINKGMETMVVVPSCAAAGAIIGGVIGWL